MSDDLGARRSAALALLDLPGAWADLGRAEPTVARAAVVVGVAGLLAALLPECRVRVAAVVVEAGSGRLSAGRARKRLRELVEGLPG